jgi:hypothetical protein
MEKTMQPESLNEEKLIPLDTTGENIDVELKEKPKEENEKTIEVKEEVNDTKPEKEGTEHEQYLSKKKKKEDPRLRINELTGKWREAERQQQAAIEYAKAVQKENEDLKKKNATLDNSYIEEFKTRATTEENNIKKELQEALQAGDFGKQADLQSKLTDTILQRQRAEMTLQKKIQEEKNKPEEKPVDFTPQQKAPPVPEPSQKAQEWVSKNSWFGNGSDSGHDVVKTMATYGIHRQLITEGVDPESDDYYNEIDTRLSRYFSGNTDTSQVGGNRVAQTVASAARNGKATGRRTVTLTPSQVALAKKLGVPLEKYAEQLQLMQKS